LVYELIPPELEESLPNDSYIMWIMLYIQLGLPFTTATLILKRNFFLLIFPLQWNVE